MAGQLNHQAVRERTQTVSCMELCLDIEL